MGWSVSRLGDLLEHSFGGATPSTAMPAYWDGSIPWITTAVLEQNDIFLTRYQRKITDLAVRETSTNVAPAGSVLIGTRVGVGKTAVAVFDVAINQDLTAVVTNDQLDPEFLALLLKAPAMQRWFGENKRGTTIRGVPRSDVLNLNIPLPPLPEQRAIAYVLRTVQEAKEATERVIAATRELKKSLMCHLFTYGPVPLDQVDQVPLKETEIGLVPECWDVVSLRECARVQTGIAKGRKVAEDIAVDVPYLRVANVQDGYLDLSEVKTIRIARDEVPRYQLRAGDVLVTEGGDMDKLGRGFLWQGQVPGAVHQNHVFAIRPKASVLLPEFLAYLIQTSSAKTYFLNVAHRTTHLACINSTKLKALPALIPPLSEQEQIVDTLGVVDSKIQFEESRVKALDTLFTSLLHHLMTGKMRVPASVDDFSAVGEGADA